MNNTNKQSGFSIVEVVIAVVAVAVIGTAGFFVYQHNRVKTGDTTGSTQTTNQSGNRQQNTTGTADPYKDWKTFTDNASANTSGISIKYPSDWQVVVGGSKTYAWKISQAANAQNSIIVSYTFADGSKTARQEWENCGPTDACGGSADDKTLTGSESTINGFSAYNATMQNSFGTFHVTVIRGDKSASPAGTSFVVFKTYATEQTALSTYDAITASATFPN